MEVKILTRPSSIEDMEKYAALAALTCHGNAEKEHVAREVLERIIKLGHESILEHIYLTYSIKGLSRACLQELVRHRHLTLSVESTRHTLRGHIEDPEWVIDTLKEIENPLLSVYAVTMALMLKKTINQREEITNDELKYYLPECWPTNLILTSNVRELRHILTLRTAPQALKEFQELARAMYEAVPEEYKYLLQDCVYEEAANG